jgi:hypothetical protein
MPTEGNRTTLRRLTKSPDAPPRSTSERAEARRQTALDLLASLRYLERWGDVGRPELVGSVRHGLVVARDVDVEVSVDALDVAASFAVIAEVAADRRVTRALFRNEADERGWLYWEVVARGDDGKEWTIETYVSGPNDRYAGWSAEFAGALGDVLTDDARETILVLKESLAGDPNYRAMDVYRAVLEAGVGTREELRSWRATHGSTELVRWDPASARSG